MKYFNLKRQLKSQGASAKDAKALSGVAKNVSKAELPGLSPEAKKRIAAEIGIESSPLGFFTVPRLAIGGALAIFALLIGFSQAALPGSPLYSLKRGTEEVRLLLQPGFNQQDVEDRRSDEQRRLGNTQSSTDDSIDDNEDDDSDSAEDTHKSGTQSSEDHDSNESEDSSDDSSGRNSGSSGTSGSSDSSSESDDDSGSGSNSGSSGGSGSNSGSSGGSGSNSGSNRDGSDDD